VSFDGEKNPYENYFLYFPRVWHNPEAPDLLYTYSGGASLQRDIGTLHHPFIASPREAHQRSNDGGKRTAERCGAKRHIPPPSLREASKAERNEAIQCGVCNLCMRDVHAPHWIASPTRYALARNDGIFLLDPNISMF